MVAGEWGEGRGYGACEMGGILKHGRRRGGGRRRKRVRFHEQVVVYGTRAREEQRDRSPDWWLAPAEVKAKGDERVLDGEVTESGEVVVLVDERYDDYGTPFI